MHPVPFLPGYILNSRWVHLPRSNRKGIVRSDENDRDARARLHCTPCAGGNDTRFVFFDSLC